MIALPRIVCCSLEFAHMQMLTNILEEQIAKTIRQIQRDAQKRSATKKREKPSTEHNPMLKQWIQSKI